MGQLVLFLTRFLPNTWLQSFEDRFMVDHCKNRALNICIISCIFITRCNIYRYVVNHFSTRKFIRFPRQKSTLWIKQKNQILTKIIHLELWKWLLGRFHPITLKNDWMLIILCLSNRIGRFFNLLRIKFAFRFT